MVKKYLVEEQHRLRPRIPGGHVEERHKRLGEVLPRFDQSTITTVQSQQNQSVHNLNWSNRPTNSTGQAISESQADQSFKEAAAKGEGGALAGTGAVCLCECAPVCACVCLLVYVYGGGGETTHLKVLREVLCLFTCGGESEDTLRPPPPYT